MISCTYYTLDTFGGPCKTCMMEHFWENSSQVQSLVVYEKRSIADVDRVLSKPHVQSQEVRHWENGKFNDTTKISKPMNSLWCFYCKIWTYFTPFSSVSIFDFEHMLAWIIQVFIWSESVRNDAFLEKAILKIKSEIKRVIRLQNVCLNCPRINTNPFAE